MANDLHGVELTNFWRVLQHAETVRCVSARILPHTFSQVEFEAALTETKASVITRLTTLLKRTRRTCRPVFILARQSRQGLMRDFATLSRNRTRSGINERSPAWLECDRRAPDVHQRLQKRRDSESRCCDVIRKQDGEHTLFLL